MVQGYNNKVLIVDLTTGKMDIEQPGEALYRQYLGGNGLGLYYCMRDIPKGADPLGPENVLVLSAGVIVGAPVMGASRMNANAKSPVTGGIGDAQAGGFWAPAFKFSGFDAVVFKGKSEKPVYLYTKDGEAELRDASGIWGMTNKEYETALREELGKEVVVAGIGPAGEKQARFACIINERKHSCGRTGMGAVMGSKNVKCVASVGKKPMYEYSDKKTLQDLARHAGEFAKTDAGFAGMQMYGTNGGIGGLNDDGGLPTKNFSEGYFEPTDDTLTSMVMNDTISIGNERCYMCNIACKRHVKCTKEEHGVDVDPDYGGPEYETVASFGSYLLIDDLPTIAKCNEICNAYGIDTISAGATIAFVMECYENGILTKDDLDGLEMNFGNRANTITLLEKICKREGCGDMLAEGPTRAAKVIGQGSDKFDMSVKGNPHPAHMPQRKNNLGLHYAVNPYGSDHVSVLHDPQMFAAAFEDLDSARQWYTMGLYRPVPHAEMNEDKVTFNYYTQMLRMMTDSIGGCYFAYGPFNMYQPHQMVDIVNACTGWGTSLWELMKSGERIFNLMKLFNQREGLTVDDDKLPEKNYKKPFTYGPSKGSHVDYEKFLETRELYYRMCGWNGKTGEPEDPKLIELNLMWTKEYM